MVFENTGASKAEAARCRIDRGHGGEGHGLRARTIVVVDAEGVSSQVEVGVIGEHCAVDLEQPAIPGSRIGDNVQRGANRERHVRTQIADGQDGVVAWAAEAQIAGEHKLVGGDRGGVDVEPEQRIDIQRHIREVNRANGGVCACAKPATTIDDDIARRACAAEEAAVDGDQARAQEATVHAQLTFIHSGRTRIKVGCCESHSARASFCQGTDTRERLGQSHGREVDGFQSSTTRAEHDATVRIVESQSAGGEQGTAGECDLICDGDRWAGTECSLRADAQFATCHQCLAGVGVGIDEAQCR